jgi:hypothetical protein
VLRCNAEQFKAIPTHVPLGKLGRSKIQLEFAQARFDCNLSETCNAYHTVIANTLNKDARFLAQPWASLYKPDEDVRIKQEPHCI